VNVLVGGDDPAERKHLGYHELVHIFSQNCVMDLVVYSSELSLCIDSVRSGAHTVKGDKRWQLRCLRVSVG
jgi:hypothetical protein